jgi:hypothetical protein
VDLPDVAPPQIDDAISDTELEDLATIAEQNEMSLEAAIDRYAWNDNFALMVAAVRDAAPNAFAGAEIVDAGHAWVGFADGAPRTASDLIDIFRESHPAVAVEIRTTLSFTEAELERAITTIHYAVFDAEGVHSASTSFDSHARRITTTAVISGDASASLDDLRNSAVQKLREGSLEGILDRLEFSLVLSFAPSLIRRDAHAGGEILRHQGALACTSAFTVQKQGSATRGPSTVGHCPDQLSDDSASLTFKGDYEGQWGDFQWHTGPQTNPDDFYSGDFGATETNLRDVAGVGLAVPGQGLCRNGASTHKHCKDVWKTNVCADNLCHLVQMNGYSSAGGDSGGPVYFSSTAYGLHVGGRYDPYPNLYEVFAEAARLPTVLAVEVAK